MKNIDINIRRRRRSYKIQQAVCIILSICCAALLTGAVLRHKAVEREVQTMALQKDLAKEVFRFHVLADSDEEEAQAVKLKVRDRIITYMKEEMGETQSSAAETKKWAKTHLDELEETACEVIREEGYTYGAHAEVRQCYFPEKMYGDVTFPQGNYEALRICLGNAEGQNWWCVLYPNLCFMNSTCAVVSKEGKEELKEALTAEEYEMVTAASDFRIKSFFFGK